MPSKVAIAAASAALLAGAGAGVQALGAAGDNTPDCPASVGGRPLTNHIVQGDPNVDAELTCYYEPPDQTPYSIAVSWVTGQSDGHNIYGCGHASPDPDTVFVSPDHEADSSVNSKSAPQAFVDAAKQLLAEVSQRFAKPCANAKLPRFKWSFTAHGIAHEQKNGYLHSRAQGSGSVATSQLTDQGTGRIKRASGTVVVEDVYDGLHRALAIRISGPARGETVAQLEVRTPHMTLRGVVTSENRPHCHVGAHAKVFLTNSDRVDIDACDVHDSWSATGNDKVSVSIRKAS